MNRVELLVLRTFLKTHFKMSILPNIDLYELDSAIIMSSAFSLEQVSSWTAHQTMITIENESLLTMIKGMKNVQRLIMPEIPKPEIQ